jgi:ABC-type nitrate/sulfonate/bicarbonate transport system ATPase subunit
VTHDLREAVTISDRIKVKNSEEYLEHFRETWRILDEEFV